MKIAFITNLCTHYRFKLFKLLSEHHNFDFYFYDEPNKTKEDIKHLSVLKGEKTYNFSATKILRKIYEKRYEVIIRCTNNKWLFLGSFVICKLLKAKFIAWHTIWYYPNTFQYKSFSWILLKVMRDYADAVVVYGEHGKKFLIEKGVKPEKIFIAWQTVDNDLYGKEFSESDLKSVSNNLLIPFTKKVVLYVGRLVHLKGIEYLLEALNEVNKTEFLFIAIGDGELRDMIKEYCEEKGIDYRLPGIVHFDELPIFYKVADVLVLPSITTKTFKEPWGLVVNEAFNQGCPAIVTDAVGAGVGGLVKDGVNGFIVPEKNVEALSNAIREVIANNSLRTSLSLNAKQEIKHWTYDRQAKGFLDAVSYSINN